MPRKLPKEIRIEALVGAAVEEFLEKGYEAASVEAIAKRAGVSKGGFYHHFSNKEVLLMEANRKLSAPVEKMMAEAAGNRSAREGLRAYIRGYLDYWIAHPREMSFLFLSMSKANDSELLAEYYTEYVAAAVGFFTGMFERAARSGELEIDDPKTYGISLMGALDGMISYAAVFPEEDAASLSARLEKMWLGEAAV